MDHSAYDVDERRIASVIINEITELAWEISWIDLDALYELLERTKFIKSRYQNFKQRD